MQLDKTRIAIRERGLLEILDLAPRVIRFHVAPFVATWLAGVVPFLLLNYWLFGWMADSPGEYPSDKFEYWPRYFWTMSLMVFIEAPLATVAMTLYLGDVMFLQRSTPWSIASTIWRLSWRLFVCQGVVRGILIGLLLIFAIERYDRYSGFEVFLIMLATYTIVFRSWRPYLNEIVLLERNPLTARSSKALTIRRRSSALHNPNAGDLFARYIAVAGIAVLMTVAFVYGFWFVGGVLLNDWNWGPIMVHVCVPLAMWITAGYFCVVRYLSYLDLRIRREGWEVELRMRAEAGRLARQVA